MIFAQIKFSFDFDLLVSFFVFSHSFLARRACGNVRCAAIVYTFKTVAVQNSLVQAQTMCADFWRRCNIDGMCKFDALNYNIIQNDDGSPFLPYIAVASHCIEWDQRRSPSLARSVALAAHFLCSSCISWCRLVSCHLCRISCYSKLLYIRFIFLLFFCRRRRRRPSTVVSY